MIHDRLLRAARNLPVDRPPIWIMRQAGRYLKAYRDLRQKYPSFQERSETPDLAVEISLQPFYAFKPDRVIMFSDILTPLPVQGNLDPSVLLGTHDLIQQRTIEVIRKAGNKGHIMNLGQGILHTTPEENVAFFFETVKQTQTPTADYSTLIGKAKKMVS
ncbi:MAG: hypothetical protein KME07_20490 [Pegethrix bostrychoides GSE-TBD4-15B]|uniref:Uroporphyrinogen decarboxylase (URO-D) domain-containing protein n=1 Tax=Pegethrix bostrychoides GSE-TBD4-15B TaxID=2839662 RepID=A0A951PFW5_9CYAN|nr:hypothetical protein [Pegethrix bostrychoides GSE-TBD4-15B]